ncbi:MAG: hypothetical protein WC383_11245 [Gammaproteobacteria bacterium]
MMRLLPLKRQPVAGGIIQVRSLSQRVAPALLGVWFIVGDRWGFAA